MRRTGGEIKSSGCENAYPLTSRLLKRLVALYKKTGRIWSIEQFEKANEDKKLEARARIAQAIQSLKEEGTLITIAEVVRRAKSHWATVKKNWDLMAVVLVHTFEENQGSETETNLDLLARSADVINPGGGCTTVVPVRSLELVTTEPAFWRLLRLVMNLNKKFLHLFLNLVSLARMPLTSAVANF